MREIEIKLKVSNLEEIETKLKEKGCILSEPIHQHDVNYSKDANTDAWHNGKEGDVMLRIRHLKNTAQFNLKQQRSGEGDNLEYETEVTDPKAMHQILLTLGYAPEIEVTKIRRKGKLGEYEICLDQVEKLGNFMEIEKMTDDDVDPEAVRAELFKAIEFLDLSPADEETRGYDTQVYQLELK